MSSYNWNNFVLYIKRAELNHDEEYIKNALEIIGDVKSVSFILKTNEKGHKYNGAIVHFNNMNIGPNLYQIVEQFETNEEKTAKLYHTEYRYWIVNEYIDHSFQKDCVEINETQSSLTCDSKEELVFQYNLLQKRCERQERKMMDYEEQLTRKWFENVDLQIQLDKKDCLIEWKKKEIEEQKEKHELELNRIHFKSYHFETLSNTYHKKNSILEEELTNKNKHIECLQQDLDLVSNMLAYYEQKYGNYIEEVM
jgi:hypothetical protein